MQVREPEPAAASSPVKVLLQRLLLLLLPEQEPRPPRPRRGGYRAPGRRGRGIRIRSEEVHFQGLFFTFFNGSLITATPNIAGISLFSEAAEAATLCNLL